MEDCNDDDQSTVSPTNQTTPMEDLQSPCSANEDFCWGNEDLEKLSNPIATNYSNHGRDILGFSLTSPDLVICAGSPDIPNGSCAATLDSSLNAHKRSVELSFENGIDASENLSVIDTHNKNPCVRFSTVCETFEHEPSPDSSFELFPLQSDEVKDLECSGFSINAGSTDRIVNFVEDNSFTGGDKTRTDAVIQGENGFSIYQTARFGNFSYMFPSLAPGNYAIDLHFAEIVFTTGPPGIRVFDVFIQDKKVVSSLDIYAQVGANKPLVISDLKASVEDEKGLTIRFEGVIGNPIICGISVKRDSSAYTREAEIEEALVMSQAVEDTALPKNHGEHEVGKYQKLLRNYEHQKMELLETRKALTELKLENQRTSEECQKAQKSLRELQNELMRKSMHVGSLAFAIEGQVKEKSKWFSALRDLTRRIKIMKMEQIKLSEEATEYKKYITDITEVSSIIQSTIKQEAASHEDLKVKFIDGARERKELYNKVLQLKGNIRVFCRCRPLNLEETAAGATTVLDFESAKDGELVVTSNGGPKKTFKFDAVFGPQADQHDIFKDTAPCATSVLDGYNVCIFAYGQTGTGKTFTMEGTKDARGVNYRTLEKLFRIIGERQNLYTYDVSVSALEVYNEQIRDLLATGSQPGGAARRLEIRQVAEGIHHVPGLVEAQVQNMTEVWDVLQAGSNARAVGSTNVNEHSSRSHCIHCVMVKGENLLNGECTKSKLWLVDLAGSERVAKTEVQGERLKETQNINRSLSALGDVISALANKSPHVPFRNSKLTHLLQDSLGGDSKTLMFVQISPNENDLSETLCSLNFASRVRGVELGPAKRQLDVSEFLKYKQMVEKTKQDMKIKDTHIKRVEETLYGSETKIKERDLKIKNLQDKIKELEAQLLVERKLARQHVDTRIAEQQQLKQQEDQNTAPLRPLLMNRQFGSTKIVNETATATLTKDQLNLSRALTETNSFKPPVPFNLTDGIGKYNDPGEKENNPGIAEQFQPIRRTTGRASISTPAQRTPFAPAPRRNSLIPMPSLPNFAQVPSTPLLPLPESKDGDCDEGMEEFFPPEQVPCPSPKNLKSGNKKLSSILRRSLHKKVQLKSPMQQHLRRVVGVNVGMEKVRLSIGSRGRMAHRVVLGSGRKAVREVQPKQSQKEKERGWNI